MIQTKMISSIIISVLSVISVLPSSINVFAAAFVTDQTCCARNRRSLIELGNVGIVNTCSRDDPTTESPATRFVSTKFSVGYARFIYRLPPAFLVSVSVDEATTDVHDSITSTTSVSINLVDKAEQSEYSLLHSQRATEELCVATIDAWGRAGRPEKAEAIFQFIIKNYSNDTIGIDHNDKYALCTISRLTYHALMTTQIRARNFTRVIEIITMMENSPIPLQQPTLRDYNAILFGYMNGGRQYVRDAERLIERMKNRNDGETKPDPISYGYLLDLFLLSDYDNVDEKIDRVLDHVAQLATGAQFFTINYMRPYMLPFNKALAFWKVSTRPDAAERAERIVHRLEELGLADKLAYTQFMSILINSDKRYHARQIAERVENIGNNMIRTYQGGNKFVKPSVKTWNTILNAWAQCGEPERAEQLLMRMENEFHNDTDMAPNVVSYSTVMDGWVKSNRRDATDRMEDLLERLKKRSLNATAATMSDLRPNQRTNSALIRAYVKQNTMAATQKAEDYLREMYHEYEAGNMDMKPNAILISIVLDAWGTNGTKYGAERAETLLDFAIAVNKDRNDLALCPNEFSFTSVIAAWGRARCIGKSVHARQVLNKMITLQESGLLDTIPNAFCYTAVLNACAHCIDDESEKRVSLRIAIETYKELEKNGTPNHVTYLTMLIVLQNLLPPSTQRSKAATDLFQNAIRDGCVGFVAIQRLKSILNNNELKSFYPKLQGDVNMDQIPKDWGRRITRPERVLMTSSRHAAKP